MGQSLLQCPRTEIVTEIVGIVTGRCHDIGGAGDSFSILNVVLDFSHRYISSSLRPRKNTSSVCSPSPSEDGMSSHQPGNLDGPGLCFLRG